MFWDLSNNLRTWGDKLRKKDNCSCCLGIPCWEVGPGFMETDMANPEVCWVTGAVLLAVLFNSIKYFSQRMSYLKKTWKGSPFTLSPSRVESPNIWKQLQMECCELGKNKKKKRMWKWTTDDEDVIKEQHLFFWIMPEWWILGRAKE